MALESVTVKEPVAEMVMKSEVQFVNEVPNWTQFKHDPVEAGSERASGIFHFICLCSVAQVLRGNERKRNEGKITASGNEPLPARPPRPASIEV